MSSTLRTNRRPLYLQVTEALRLLIQHDEYGPGDALPSEESLARELGVSRLTVREALGYLENDGMIQRRRGVGTFVCEPLPGHFAGGIEQLDTFRSLACVAGLQASTVTRSVGTRAASPEEAAQLQVPAGTELAWVQATQAIDGQQTAYFDGLAPLALVNLDDLRAGDGSLLEYFFDSGAPVPTHTRSRLYAVNADSTISRLLGIDEGTAVLHLVELCFLNSHQPLALSNNYFLTHCFNFFITRRVDSSILQPSYQEMSPCRPN